jgi:pimeloyl-ACP methyl ester carboxylesterase
MRHFQDDMMGYSAIQGTRPQTLAYGLTGSPVGQLAWIVEKFREWTDPSAELPEDAVDRDHLLTNVSIYWLTDTAGSSASHYYEVAHDPTPVGAEGAGHGADRGGGVLTQDVAVRRLAEREHNVVHWSEFEAGGHFAAMEAPEFLVGDVRRFFRKLGGQ